MKKRYGILKVVIELKDDDKVESIADLCRVVAHYDETHEPVKSSRVEEVKESTLEWILNASIWKRFRVFKEEHPGCRLMAGYGVHVFDHESQQWDKSEIGGME